MDDREENRSCKGKIWITVWSRWQLGPWRCWILFLNLAFLQILRQLKRNKINRLKIITEIRLSYHILISPPDWGEGFNNSIMHLYPTHWLRGRLWPTRQGHARQQKDWGKKPQKKPKPNTKLKGGTHPGRDVSHSHQNEDGASAGKKAALKPSSLKACQKTNPKQHTEWLWWKAFSSSRSLLLVPQSTNLKRWIYFTKHQAADPY